MINFIKTFILRIEEDFETITGGLNGMVAKLKAHAAKQDEKAQDKLAEATRLQMEALGHLDNMDKAKAVAAKIEGLLS